MNQVDGVELRLAQARQLLAEGQTLQAELLYVEVLKARPAAVEALMALAELARRRGDFARAHGMMFNAAAVDPTNRDIKLNLAMLDVQAERPKEGLQRLEALVLEAPDFFVGWLLLGQLREHLGRHSDALLAYLRAVAGAREQGLWLDETSTPPNLLPLVLHAIESLRSGRKELLHASYTPARERFGAAALQRVDHALAGYLREIDTTPADERQRPKFFFFPGLPPGPYHDPFLQPWASSLTGAFPAIRQEALRVLSGGEQLPDFIADPNGTREFVSGEGAAPSWKAFFFFRHGRRHDANHAKCPATSKVLDSLPLCRLEDQAPEVLFSVLAPGSHINAHHGVSNVRLVMHLPLLVPPDCALNLPDHGMHAWEEGRLVMFDDTYLHEAWNRSAQPRVVLLMDCWNPHLSEAERSAVKQLLETITELHRSDRLQPVWQEA
jgi:aspartyl/asparaginyl beta-hydroxylase (cupin superfamily)/Tfp pilus assembly protein PilF